MRVVSVGHALFAATIFALGVAGFLKGDFAAIWQQVPKAFPARGALVYLCAIVSLSCGAGLLFRRAAAPAARVLLVYLLVWLLLFKMPDAVRAPMVAVSWESCGETTVLVAASWVLYAWFAADWDRRRLSFAVAEAGVQIARVLYGLSMTAFGVAHFAYVQETASLVPAWLPSHAVWVYLTGSTYIAAGVAILTGVYGRLAAALSLLQIGMFTLLVWLPVVVTGSAKPDQWSETALSWALTAAAWVVADSYRKAGSHSSRSANDPPQTGF
jgi:uncharacterized membrane protein